jgi:hypothetical protein
MKALAKCWQGLAVTVVLFAIWVGSASAASIVCSFGTGNAGCIQPSGVALSALNSRLYVADHGNDRIQIFNANGTPFSRFGVSGTAPGQLSGPGSLAIDNDPLSSAFGDVYVVDEGDAGEGGRIQRFGPEGEFKSQFGLAQVKDPRDFIAVGPGGVVYLLDFKSNGTGGQNSQVFRFSPAGTLLGVSALPGTELVHGIVVDSSGDFFVAQQSALSKFVTTEPQATLVESFLGIDNESIALDEAGNLYAGQREGTNRVVTKYDSTGTPLSRFGYGEVEFNLIGLAVGASGVYASERFVNSESEGGRTLSIPFPVPGPISCCVEANPVSNTKATLQGKVNPEGKPTTYHFEYVDQASFEASGFTTAKSTPDTPIGEDVSIHEVSAVIGCPAPTVPPQAECLDPETEYQFRLVATNSDAPTGVISDPDTFTTKQPLEMIEAFASEVGPDSAQLHAKVNPLGIPATGYFEFITEAAYQANGGTFAGATQVPNVSGGAAPLDLGSAEAVKDVSVQLSSLALDTTYRYRFIATDPFIAPPGLISAEPTFHTSSAPPEEALDPCPNAAFRTGSSAHLPDCRAYEMVSPVEKGNTDIAVRVSAQNFQAGFEQSALDGNGFSFSSEKAFGGALGSPYTSQYLASRGEGGWSTQPISPSHGQELNEFLNIKVDAEYRLFSGDLSSGWLIHGTDARLAECGVDGYPNLYRRLPGGGYETLTTAKPLPTGSPPSPQIPGQYWPELQGVSADGTHAVFRANAKLTSKAASNTSYQLYEHVAGEECGELRLVSVLPNGSTATGNSSAGTSQNGGGETREHTVVDAVSADGSHIFWSAATSGPGPLYVRIDGKETVQLSAGPAQFWSASPDGSKAIYTVGENLFEYDVPSKTQTLIAGGSAGLAGSSEDLSRIYFVSKLQLGGEGEAGKPNLYLREGGASRLIGTLAAGDLSIAFPYNGLATVSTRPIRRGTRTTPDGSSFAFVSQASLTGYDNRDAEDGEPNVELFVYRAASDSLACVSCNPGGGRPRGRLIEGESSQTKRISAQMTPWPNDLYQPHNLSADGRHLFFDSFEALVPRDTNGRADVYEWTRATSKAECDAPASNAELYVPAAEGCLSLISSGQSPEDSESIDATPSGSDVFFKTSSSLLLQDPGLIDVYDARVGGGFPPPPPPTPPCEGEACQGPPSPPNDPTPSSLQYHGPGNVTACPKGKVRKGKKCVAKKKHKKQKQNKQAKKKGKKANKSGRAGR